MKSHGSQQEDNAIFQEGIGAFIKRYLKESGLEESGPLYQSIPGDGSKRAFWRIVVARGEITLIAMENPPVDDFSRRENIAYLMIGEHLRKKGIPVPRLYSSDLDRGWFIMEDMGKTNLQTRSSQERERILLYERVVEILLRLQVEGAGGFNTTWTCQTEKYDRLVMREYESNYFRDAFLINYLHIERDWSELDHVFDYLAETAAKAEGGFLLHRDFQSRNILVNESETQNPAPKIGIIDWQGARLGPLGYDLASLLIDPYTNLPSHDRTHIYNAYLGILKKSWPGRATPFQRFYPYLAVQRNLQILGAFAFLSKVRGKTYFEAYLPPALESLTRLLEDLQDRNLKTLRDVVRDLPTPAGYYPRIL
jgi:hypothetical protein